MSERDRNHPVWEVYNLLRTARLNCKYYSEKLHKVEKASTSMQIIIAASLPSSAVARLQIWTTGWGNYIWSGVLILASTLAFLQPFFKLSEKIKKYDSISINKTPTNSHKFKQPPTRPNQKFLYRFR